LALGAALVLVVGATRLLYIQWRAIHPPAAVADAPPRELFESHSAPQFKDVAPALIAALTFQCGLVSALIGNSFAAAALFSIAAAMLTLSALVAGAYDVPTERGLPRSILGLALTVILAAGFTVGGMAGHIRRGRLTHPDSTARPGPIQSARALLERL